MDLFSAITYTFYGLISVGTAYVAQRNKSKVMTLLLYIFCVLFWGLRKDIGFDYIGYVEIFHDIQHGNLSYVEPGYFILNKIFAFLQDGYKYVLFISTAITFGFLFNALLRYKILWQGLLYSLVFQFQFMAANQVRQSMAIAAFLSFVHLLQNKHYIKYTVCVILTAFLCHTSALFLILGIPISFLRINRFIACISVIIVYGAYLAGIWSNLGFLLFSILPVPDNYAHFLMTGWVFNESVGLSIVQMFNICLGLYILWNKSAVPNYIISIYFTGLLCYIMFVEYHLFLRMSFYFFYVNILAISFICKRNPGKSQIIILISALFFFFLCCQSTNMHGVIPYNSILYTE